MSETTRFTDHIKNTLPLFQLSSTVIEAANHGAAVPGSVQEMRSLCLQGISSLLQRSEALYPEEMKEVVEKQAQLLVALADSSAKDLPRLVSAWMGPFLTALLRPFRVTLQTCGQLTPQEAEEVVTFVKELGVFSPLSRGQLFLEVGLKCQASAPLLSWQTMMDAFETAPDLVAANENDYLHGYVYHPGEHPQTEFDHCPICGGKNGVPYRAACSCFINSFTSMFLPAKLWMKCPECGNLYTRYFPTEFLSISEETPTALTPHPERMDTQGTNGGVLHIWGEILKKLSALTQGQDLLEVGVGKGELISVAQELGFDVTAVELVGSIAQHVADVLDIPVIQADFLKLAEDRQYSILTMGDIVEHLQDPVQGLQKAYRLLKDGGVLWLSTPNYESSFSRMMKVNDPMWREVEHISYFNKDGLLRVLESVGFSLEDYTVSNRYNGSMELILRKGEKRS